MYVLSVFTASLDICLKCVMTFDSRKHTYFSYSRTHSFYLSRYFIFEIVFEHTKKTAPGWLAGNKLR